jgi:hypothetical protein
MSENILKKYTFECGAVLCSGGKSRHYKSAKYIGYIESKSRSNQIVTIENSYDISWYFNCCIILHSPVLIFNISKYIVMI